MLFCGSTNDQAARPLRRAKISLFVPLFALALAGCYRKDVVDTTPPAVPTGLTALAAGSTTIHLSWQPSADNVGVAGYQVERCQGAACSTFEQDAAPTGTSIADIGLAAATSYSYRVRATDRAGNRSGFSSIASATTQAASGSAYTTQFGLTENPISEGGKWINGKAAGLDWNSPQTLAGKACASVLSGVPNRYNDSIAHLNTSFKANQYAQGTVYRAAGYAPADLKHEIELLLRFQITAHNARGYEVLWGHTGYVAVVRWNGPLGDYTALYESGDPGIGPAVDGDILRAEMAGNIIRVFKNGLLVATADATSHGGTVWTEGQPGMGFWPVNNASIEKYGWKRYEAGSL